MIYSDRPSVLMVEQTRNFIIPRIFVLLYHLFGDFCIFKRRDIMAKISIRKNDSLDSSVVRLRHEMKIEYGKYSDCVSELALLTKSKLKPVIKSLIKKPNNKGTIQKVEKVFGKIANVLFDMVGTHTSIDEIVQVIGGLEFATNNTVDKLAEILKDQELQQARMTKEINQLRKEFELIFDSSSHVENLEFFFENVQEFQIAFSLFQDRVIASIPRIMRVLDELDREEELAKKYGKTKQI